MEIQNDVYLIPIVAVMDQKVSDRGMRGAPLDGDWYWSTPMSNWTLGRKCQAVAERDVHVPR